MSALVATEGMEDVLVGRDGGAWVWELALVARGGVTDGENAGYPYRVVVPHVTRGDLVSWVAANRANDVHGSWDRVRVVGEGDGALVVSHEAGREVFAVSGVVDGAAVYAIDGGFGAFREFSRESGVGVAVG